MSRAPSFTSDLAICGLYTLQFAFFYLKKKRLLLDFLLGGD
jgi:hypothetical protein